MRVVAAARTHIGLVKQRNEDSFYLGERLFAVADGLGGHPAGDVASATVIEALHPYDRHVGSEELVDTLGRGVAEANAALRRRTSADGELAGMGSTLVALLLGGSAAALANIGDSRAYRMRDGGLKRLTDDHSLGRLISDPALAGRLTRFIDGRPDGRSPDLTVLEVLPGDRFLLCSDGLTAVVTDDLIAEALRTISNPVGTAEHLAARAVGAGGPDNVTVLVLGVTAG